MEVSKLFYMSEIPLFEGFAMDELKEIEKHLVMKKLDAGAVVYKQGSSGRSVCFVAEGELEVTRESEDGEETVASKFKGDSVGEMSIIDGLARSAGVRAATPALVLVLKRDAFETLVAERSDIAFKLLMSLAKALSLALRDRAKPVPHAKVA